MKKKLWRITSCVLTVCLLAVPLYYLTNLFEQKSSLYEYQAFFEQEADFDVLFLGTGHIKNDIHPMELWNNYGIVSYNFGSHASEIATLYWVMENALDYTTPKLIVVDCLYLEKNVKTCNLNSYVHTAMDAFPLSVTKIKATMDLLNDPVLSKKIEDGRVVDPERRSHIGLLWNFSVYHSRWNELGKGDFRISKSTQKGAETCIRLYDHQDIPKVDRSEKMEEDTVGVQYIKKIIESCQERNIDILLTYLPFDADALNQKNANRVYDIAAEYGVNYLNFLDMDIVDYNTDFGSYYLNPTGVKKLTDYLGPYMIENYKIPDQRNNAEYFGWFEDYEAYKNHIKYRLQTLSSWDTCLTLLADRNFDSIIEIKDPDILNDDTFVKLIKNLGIDMLSVSGSTNYLIICKGGEQAEAVSLDVAADSKADTMMGILRISHEDSGKYSVYLNDVECFRPDDDNGDIRIYVRDSNSLKTVWKVVF